MTKTVPFTSFYFIRHGETDWNHQHIRMGLQDIPLNEKGIEQAHHVSTWLNNLEVSSIAVSPLKRALETAKIISLTIHKPITLIHDLRECCWGAMEGQPAHDGKIEKWLAGETYPGGEAVHDFEKRVLSGFKQALSLPGPVLIVSHGGVYCAIQRLISLPFLAVRNCVPIFHRPPEDESLPWLVRDVSQEPRKGACLETC